MLANRETKLTFAGNFKFLIASGRKQDLSYSGASEIISVESSTVATCPAVPDFPKKVFGSAGALIQQKIPLVCSGYNERVSCYLLKNNAWEQTGSLNQARYRAAMLPRSPFQNPAHEAIIIGGFDGVVTMEVFNGTSWTFLGPSLPVGVAAACAVYTNPSTIHLISGVHGGALYSQDTYYLDSRKQTWEPGPKVTNGRTNFGCGRLPTNQNTVKLSTIIVGGFNGAGMDSVEILDDDSSTWRPGPNLPGTAFGAPIFEDPRGGVIYIGGSTTSGYSGTLYRLGHAGQNAKWETLSQTSKLKYFNTVAIPIPDEIAQC